MVLATFDVIAVVTAVFLVVLTSLGVPVTRSRIVRFARRSALVLTPENGDVVVRYLSTTRRWRASGIIVGMIAQVIWSLWHDRTVTFGGLGAFAGWFAGAVIAEWRVSSVASGSRRAARLVPRRRADYLSSTVRRMPAFAALCCLGVAVVVAVGGVANDQNVWLTLVVWLLATMVGLVVILGVQNHVLGRSQPLLAASLLAADEAIRVRSLRVLTGAAVAAAGLPAAALVGELATAYPSIDSNSMAAVAVMTYLVAVAIGAQIATSPVRGPRVPSEMVFAT
jgi:hypothetical protein